MIKIKLPPQKGQIILLFALVLVGLLAFSALAIDGAMVYTDRRSSQSAADAAALAGMRVAMIKVSELNGSTFDCDSNGNWVTSRSGWSAPAWLTSSLINDIFSEVQTKAKQNGFDIGVGLADNNGVALRCGKENGANYLDVAVIITSDTKTSFLQIFSNQTGINSTVESISRGTPVVPALAGYAIYVLDDNCSNDGINFKGGGNANPSIDIEDGGAFSRSCLDGNNNSHLFIRADTAINCLDQGSYACGTTGQFSPGAQKIKTDPLADFHIDIPDCSDRTIAPTRTASGDTLEPGYYTNVGSATMLKPGLYCIDSDDGFGKNLTTIAGNGYDEGVTIVFMTDGANYKYTGQTHWNIKAAKSGGNNAPNVVPGAVVISNEELTLYFNGNAEASFWGTVYMPKAHLTLGGTSDTVAVASQIIVHDLLAHGTTTLSMKFDDAWFVQAPPSLSLQK